MKYIFCVLLSVLLFAANGCTTYNVVQYAKGYPENVAWFTYQTRYTPPKPAGDHQPHLAYYALTPFTVPLDVITLPVQFVDYWYVLLGNISAQ